MTAIQNRNNQRKRLAAPDHEGPADTTRRQHLWDKGRADFCVGSSNPLRRNTFGEVFGNATRLALLTTGLLTIGIGTVIHAVGIGPLAHIELAASS